jgi:hypothetical protein
MARAPPFPPPPPPPGIPPPPPAPPLMAELETVLATTSIVDPIGEDRLAILLVL